MKTRISKTITSKNANDRRKVTLEIFQPCYWKIQLAVFNLLLNKHSEMFFWAVYKYALTDLHNSPQRYCYYFHFTDEETEAQKLNYLPNSAVLEQDLNQGCPALGGPHSHSPSKGLLGSVKAVLWLSLNMQTAFGVPLFYWQYKARFPYFCSASNNILAGQDFATSTLSTFWRRNSLLRGCPVYWQDVYEQHPWALWGH